MRGPIALLFGWLLVSAWRNEVESLRMAPVRRGRIGASSAPRSITLELGSSSMERIYGENGERELALDDFNSILDAIYIHNKAYGDFDIPIKFEVPNEEPWPSNLHGLRLGKRLEKILSTPEFFDDYPEKVDELQNLGFDPRGSTLIDDWNTISQAMVVYKEKFGNLRVPSKFVVPDDTTWPRLSRNVKLGVRIAAIRSAGRYVKDHPERKAELDSMGFEWRLRDGGTKQKLNGDIFDTVYRGLETYKTMTGNLDVPVDYVVPSEEPWAEDLWNLNLGSHVQGLREKNELVHRLPAREEKLNRLGFVWEETGRALFSKKRFEMVYQALLTYKEQKGDLLVPQAFVVPSDPTWPDFTWGLKLGARVNAIRSQGTLVSNSPERRELLDQIGFEWELPSAVKRRKKKQEAGMDPNEIDDEERTAQRGPKPTPYNLDKQSVSEGITAKWRVGGELVDDSTSLDKKRLTNLGDGRAEFDEDLNILSFDQSRMFEPLASREPAARAFREYMQEREYSDNPDIRQFAHFEGHLNPQLFHKMNSRSIPPEDVKIMKKLGYKILEFGRFYWEDVQLALTTYHAHFGSVDVPHEFTVDKEMIEQGIGFDERLEGMWLGEVVAGLRQGDIDAMEETKRRKFLDSLGFDWGEKTTHLRFRFVPMMIGLKIYRHLYGFAMPQYNFVVPDEPQWPFWMSEMPLGEWAAIARVQQRVIEEHYPERYDMLNAIGFLWWVPPGSIPAKYYRPVK